MRRGAKVHWQYVSHITVSGMVQTETFPMFCRPSALPDFSTTIPEKVTCKHCQAKMTAMHTQQNTIYKE